MTYVGKNAAPDENRCVRPYDALEPRNVAALQDVRPSARPISAEKTTYVLNCNGNLLIKIDADGYTTEYTYNALDLVTHINYNGGKQVDYVYNAVGDLVRMDDWTGTNTFEYDLLSQLKKVTDTKGNVVEYTCDGNGNQTSMTYPDGSVVNYTYDGVGNLKTVTESDGRITTYSYDGMGRVVEMAYPHGWVETYHYDAIGQLLKVADIAPAARTRSIRSIICTTCDL